MRRRSGARQRHNAGRRSHSSLDRKTIYEVSHVERLSKALQQILAVDFRRPTDLRVCCATVAAGTALSRHVVGDDVFYMGLPWSTSAALKHLAGRGFVFSPREALAALYRLEASHIIDRRRLEYRDRRQTRRSRSSVIMSSAVNGDEWAQRASIRTRQVRPGVWDDRFPLGYSRRG